MAKPVKQAFDIPFGIGLDTKTNKFRVPPGKMLVLSNAVFGVGGQLTKRFGFEELPSLDDTTTNTITTFRDSLVAVGQNLYNLSPETNTWYTKGAITSVRTSVDPIVRSATSQTQQDVAVSSTGLICAVWKDSDGTSKYNVTDGESGQQIVAITSLPSTATVARVAALGRFFIITFLATVSAATHLQYVAIPINNVANPTIATDIATNVAALTSGYDVVIANNNLYLAWSATGPTIKVAYLDNTLILHTPVTIAARTATKITLAQDTSTPTPTIWVSYWDTTNNNLYGAAFSSSLNVILASTVLVNSAAINQVTSVATGGSVTVFYQKSATYSYSSGIETDFVSRISCTTAGVVGSAVVVARGVALGSKAFILNSIKYIMVAYGSNDTDNDNYQPTYFLVDSTGNVIAKLAYTNGGGYPSNQVLPQANVDGELVQIGYLYKDLLTSVNKSQGLANSAGIYAQTGVNLASFDLNTVTMSSAETGGSLHFAGGFLWMYDGVKPVEHNFHLWPEDVFVSTANTGGLITNQQYFYVATYEWTDGAGNIHRSAPSVPFTITTSGSNVSVNTVNVPTLRLTYKVAPNAIRIVIYRWSQAQQNYYQITSVGSPTLNDPTVDSIAYVDTQADSAILGNQLLYTTGGVVENIAAPACTDVNLYKTRFFLIDAEDENLLWYSKQVIQNTPVEMSDLFTIYIPPTVGAQGSTGTVRCIAPMDEKNVFFKSNAIYYNTGTGPDNAGQNNDFSDVQFITSTVGCDNPNSIVFIPNGLMFQSSKGIWLLARDFSTSYIGAPVQAYNDFTVLSATSVPGTNQVRFTLENGVVLMYDYFYDQWGTFDNVSAISSTVYQGVHTYLNQYGQVFKQSEEYLDGSRPVNRKFTTAWFSMAGLQGFERAYYFYLLGNYISPHKLQIEIAYDYNPNPSQTLIFTPDNYNPLYGSSDGVYGDESPYGGNSDVEQERIFFENQKCQSFQVTVTEIFDNSYGTVAGEGFTLAGINLVIGTKKAYATLKASRSTG